MPRPEQPAKPKEADQLPVFGPPKPPRPDPFLLEAGGHAGPHRSRHWQRPGHPAQERVQVARLQEGSDENRVQAQSLQVHRGTRQIQGKEPFQRGL